MSVPGCDSKDFSVLGRAAAALGVVVAAGLVARVLMVMSRPPVSDPDTASYVELARDIRLMSFRGWDGARTPVYPLLLLAGGCNLDTARIVQILIGIATASILVLMVVRRTQSGVFAAMVGLAYVLDLGQMSFESALMSETLCTFFLLASVFVLDHIVSGRQMSERERLALCATLGLLTAVTALTRPLYSFVIVIYFFAVRGLAAPWQARTRWWAASLTALVAPAAGLMLAWCAFNWLTVGYFGLMSTVGFGLSNQSGEFMEMAPDRYAAIRDPYLRAVRRQLATSGSRFEPIFDAAPEIYRETGWSDVELSRRLTRMSSEMFASHPLLYAQGVSRAWIRFWVPGAYYDVLLNHGQQGLMVRLWRLQKPFFFGINILFLLLSGSCLVRWVRRRPNAGLVRYLVALVLVASLVQAAMELGENSRYSVPTYPVVLYVVSIWAWDLRRRYSAAA